MSYLPPTRLPAVEAAAARRRARCGDGARGRRARWRASTPLGGAPRTRAAVRDRRDLLRHPPRALPAGHRAAPCRPGAGRCSAWWRRRRRNAVRAGARRRQPEEHPRRTAGPGVARRRMRLVGRSGVRPRLLPQPPAAEVPVDTAGQRRLPRALRRARRRPISQASTGSRAPRSSVAPPRCCPGCCWRASTASRRSSTSAATRQRDAVRRVRHAAAAPARWIVCSDVRAAWPKRARTMSEHRDPLGPRAPRLGQPRPADGRSRGHAARRAQSAAPSCRPAPPRARARRSTCATAARALRRPDVMRAVGQRQRRDRARGARRPEPTTRPRSTSA